MWLLVADDNLETDNPYNFRIPDVLFASFLLVEAFIMPFKKSPDVNGHNH